MTALQLVDAIVTERSSLPDVPGGAAGGACSDLCVMDQETEPLSEHKRRCIILCLFVAYDHTFENSESAVLLWLIQPETREKSFCLRLTLLSEQFADFDHNLADVTDMFLPRLIIRLAGL